MAQYTCNANMAADLLPMLVKRRMAFSIVWPSIDLAIFDGSQSMMTVIQAEAIHLNARGRGLTIAPTDKWGYFDDMAFPLMSPADLREGFEPASNLNLWEDATHQITFDGGKHWTNVILEEGNPAYYVACSDGKTSWLVDMMTPKWVVERPLKPLTPDQEATVEDILVRNRVPYQRTVTGRISDPQPQQIEKRSLGGQVRGTPNGLTVKPCPYRHPPTAVCPHCQDWERKLNFGGPPESISGPVNTAEPGKRIPMAFSDPIHQARYERGVCVECGNEEGPCRLCWGHVHCTAHVDYDPASRIPASVGEQGFQTCGFLDTEFDSDPSEVGE